uniref:Bm194 n=1 Tax=Brugia malayi TaxID=6279 RepID=A0A1I9G047_BRUMA|nr:Bm194 [Brugia malayi]
MQDQSIKNKLNERNSNNYSSSTKISMSINIQPNRIYIYDVPKQKYQG